WEGWNGKPLEEPTLFYHGLTELAANLLYSVSDEVVNIAKAFEEKTGTYYVLSNATRWKIPSKFHPPLHEEDIPFGLVVIRGTGEIVGLETPNIDRVLTRSQQQMGRSTLWTEKCKEKISSP
ncbi:unnamed protein product, partial [Pocillopora meandrina]